MTRDLESGPGARPGELVVVGDTVNTAARLQQAAGLGRCSSARRPTPQLTGCSAMRCCRRCRFKGKQSTLVAYECLRELPRPARVGPGISTRLIGRDGDLAVLRESSTVWSTAPAAWWWWKARPGWASHGWSPRPAGTMTRNGWSGCRECAALDARHPLLAVRGAAGRLRRDPGRRRRRRGLGQVAQHAGRLAGTTALTSGSTSVCCSACRLPGSGRRRSVSWTPRWSTCRSSGPCAVSSSTWPGSVPSWSCWRTGTGRRWRGSACRSPSQPRVSGPPWSSARPGRRHGCCGARRPGPAGRPTRRRPRSRTCTGCCA